MLLSWAFEAIPYLRQQVNYHEEVSCPRILRWLSSKIDKNAKFLDLFNSLKEASVQTLSDPKVVDGIKMELFGATTIIRKTILEGEANDALLTVFEITRHYDYDHNGCTNFSPNFATSSKCSSCKCQDCKAKHDGVINAINVLNSSVKEMTSKKGVILSKRISYPDTPLEIKADKRRRKDTSKCARATEEQHELKKVDVTATTEEHNMTVDNPSTASKDKEKVEPLEVSQTKECLINIIKGFNILTGLPWHLFDEVYIPINYGDEFHWVLAIVILKERRIQVYDSISQRRRSEPSSEIQKLAKILPTYLDMSGFLNQKDCGPFIATYAEYLSDGLQVPNDGLDAGLLRKRYALFWKYGEAKDQKSYATNVKDPRQPKPNSIVLDEEQLVHID
ncbi:hypothetical protein BC332_30284 [Capsicum chinense]|nr:hypothetical protein BC332_30284 [Capsicum chinense]